MDIIAKEKESLILLRQRSRLLERKGPTTNINRSTYAGGVNVKVDRLTAHSARKPSQPVEVIPSETISTQPMGLSCFKGSSSFNDPSFLKDTKQISRQLEKLSIGSELIKTSKRRSISPSKPYSATPLQRPFSTACKGLDDVARYFVEHKVQNVVVMVGAGISTLSGIPDFRTPGTGLYDNLRQYKIPYPEAIFDIDYFASNSRPFFTLARELYPSGKCRPNIVHYFLRQLFEKNVLLRIYTQNIDGLERVAGIPTDKLVEAHGTFATATCQRCQRRYSGMSVKNAIDQGEIPKCSSTACQGIIKPDIVFFGEDLPRRFWNYLHDFPQADLLLVMGTSLEVEPFASIVDATRIHIPRVLFNREPVGVFRTKKRVGDVVAQGDLKNSIECFARLLNWHQELLQLMDTCEEEAKTKEFTFGTRTPTAKSAANRPSTQIQRSRGSPFNRNAIGRNTPSAFGKPISRTNSKLPDIATRTISTNRPKFKNNPLGCRIYKTSSPSSSEESSSDAPETSSDSDSSASSN